MFIITAIQNAINITIKPLNTSFDTMRVKVFLYCDEWFLGFSNSLCDNAIVISTNSITERNGSNELYY